MSSDLKVRAVAQAHPSPPPGNIWGGGGGEETERERQRDRVSTPGPRDQTCPLPSHFFCACSGRWAVVHPVSQLQGSQPTQKGCESSYSFIPQKQESLTSCPIKLFFPDKQASTIREGGGEAHTIVMIHTLSSWSQPPFCTLRSVLASSNPRIYLLIDGRCGFSGQGGDFLLGEARTLTPYTSLFS